MPFYSPLRYPGGKRRLIPVITQLLEENNLKDIQYVEPYAGGAAVALALLLREYASVVHINDLSRDVYAFWHTVLHNTSYLCKRIEEVPITMREWHRQREIYEDREQRELVELGFATLFLNRTNRSGIISGGVIGGRQQAGRWSLDARFNKQEIVRRIERIGRYKTRIRLYQRDAREFTDEVVPDLGRNCFVFYDPPYLESGEDLYLNDYDMEAHRDLEKSVSGLRHPWLVTYDDAAIRRRLFAVYRRVTYGLSYSAQKRYKGNEVMFLSHQLRLPDTWNSDGPFMISSRKSKFPVYAKMG